VAWEGVPSPSVIGGAPAALHTECAVHGGACTLMVSSALLSIGHQEIRFGASVSFPTREHPLPDSPGLLTLAPFADSSQPEQAAFSVVPVV